MLVKHGLHIVVTIAKHACDHVLKSVLKLSTYRLQIFLLKYAMLSKEDFKDFEAITEKTKFFTR